MIDIIYEDNHLLVVNKPANLLSQKDNSKDISLVDLAKDYLIKTYNKPGDAYLGLVHRLDRPVSGLVVLAKTSKAAARLSKAFQSKNQVEKIYTALCCGYLKPGLYQDYLAKNAQNNTSFVTTKDKGKLALLDVLSCQQEPSGLYRVTLSLLTGRPHQIRVQTSSHQAPIVCDQRYNPQAEKGQIKLCASGLSFIHPTTKKRLVFTIEPPF